MIRKRIASLDDSVIHRLVVDQLVPFSKSANAGASATVAEIRKRLGKCATLVAAKGNRHPFGFISLICKSRVLYIDMLAVAPKDQSRGWGQKLMGAGEAYGKAKGCRTAQLFVDDSNPRAYHFYLRRGYEVEQYYPELGCYLMSKSIL